MKKLVFSMLILVAVFAACTKEKSVTTTTTTEQSLAVSALPENVTTYVSNNYPAETIASALKVANSTATYIVTLNTLEELAFDGQGEFLGDGEDFHHHHPHGDSLGGFEGDSTHFGWDSTHFEGDTTHGHHGGHGGHGGHGCPGNTVSLDSLPSAIAEYIAADYAAYTAQHAEIDSLCQFGAVYEVMIEQQGVDHLKLFFDLSGNFLSLAERDLYINAPRAVKDYVTTNYAGYVPRTKMEKFTLADGSIEYNIFLAMEGSHKSVFLKEDGTFVCEK